MAPTSRLPREARRAQLVDAAASAFLGDGYDKTSMDQVAQAAGVSRLIVYRNFESKEDLYRQVLREVLARPRRRRSRASRSRRSASAARRR